MIGVQRRDAAQYLPRRRAQIRHSRPRQPQALRRRHCLLLAARHREHLPRPGQRPDKLTGPLPRWRGRRARQTPCSPGRGTLFPAAHRDHPPEFVIISSLRRALQQRRTGTLGARRARSMGTPARGDHVPRTHAGGACPRARCLPRAARSAPRTRPRPQSAPGHPASFAQPILSSSSL